FSGFKLTKEFFSMDFTRKTRIGRPNRATASAKAAAVLIAAGVDPADLDPVQILRTIAADASAPASARVAACKALLRAAPQPDDPDGAGEVSADKLSGKAIKMLQRGAN